MDCFVRVAKCQGILSFWRGNLANVRPAAFTQVLLMGFRTVQLVCHRRVLLAVFTLCLYVPASIICSIGTKYCRSSLTYSADRPEESFCLSTELPLGCATS